MADTHTPGPRIALGKTALRVLQALNEHGPTPLSHGVRYAEIDAGQIRVMQSTNYLLRSQGMVEWAGGNYGRWHVRVTEYGLECLRRRSHLPGKSVGFADSYGPRDDAQLLADANTHYSDVQREEIDRAAIAKAEGKS